MLLNHVDCAARLYVVNVEVERVFFSELGLA